MYGVFYSLFGILSCLSCEFWYNLFLGLPTLYFLLNSVYCLFCENGRVVLGAIKLKRFIKKKRFITLENKEDFKKQVLRIFPKNLKSHLGEGEGERLLKYNKSFAVLSSVFISFIFPCAYFLISLFYDISTGELFFRVGSVFFLSLLSSVTSLFFNFSIINSSVNKWKEIQFILKEKLIIKFSSFFEDCFYPSPAAEKRKD